MLFKMKSLVMQFCFICGILLATQTLFAQPPKEIMIDKKTQLEIIDSVCYTLNHYYIFPEKAKEMEKTIRKNYKDKKYESIISLEPFVEKLRSDLYEICKDGHLGISYRPAETMPPLDREYTDDELEEIRKQQQWQNFGWEKAERLAGNIGYIKFDAFRYSQEAGPTAIAALNFLGYCDAIIIDLRQNGGGNPTMIQLIMSYFLEEPTHLNSFYIRETDSLQQFWTQAYVSGPTMYDCDLYVLTSQSTFSAAEEFSYNVRNLERGTLVGESTGGGAHPVRADYFPNLNISMQVPYGRAINPISGTNWEGVGVKPHIEVPQDEALEVAYLEALKKAKEKTTDESAIYQLEWVMDEIEVKQNPLNISDEVLISYTGTYGPRTITFEDGTLFYQREGNPKFKMIPMKEDYFYFTEIDFFRVLFEKDSQGNTTAIIGNYQNGHQDRSPKN